MEEQSITIRYMVTRSCLEEGIMRLLKYNEEYFPTDGVVTLTDERGREYKAEVDRENMCVWNFGPLFDELNLGVNDVVLLHPVSNTEPYRQFWVSAEIDPSKSSINRSLQKQFSPQSRARHRIKKTSLLPQVGELRSPPWGLPPELNPRLDLDNLDIEATLDGLPLFEALDGMEQVAPNWATHAWGAGWGEAYGWSEEPKQQARPLIEEEILVSSGEDSPNAPVFELEEDHEVSVSIDGAGTDGAGGEGTDATDTDTADTPTTTDDQIKRAPIFKTEEEAESEVLQARAKAAADLGDGDETADSTSDEDFGDEGSGKTEAAEETTEAATEETAEETTESNYLTELIDREMAREHVHDASHESRESKKGTPTESTPALSTPTESTPATGFRSTVFWPEQTSKKAPETPLSPALVPASPALSSALSSASLVLPVQHHQVDANSADANSVAESATHATENTESPEGTEKVVSEPKKPHGVPDGWGDLEVAQQELQVLSQPKEQPLEEPLDEYRDTSLRDELSYQPEGFGLAESGHESSDESGPDSAQTTSAQTSAQTVASERAQELKQATSSTSSSSPTTSPIRSSGQFGRSRDRERGPRGSKSKRSFASDLTQQSETQQGETQRAETQLGEQVRTFAELTGYRLEQLTPSLVRLNADLGPQFGYTVLLALDSKGCDHQAWTHSAEDYLAMLVSEEERPSRVCRLTHEALQALTEHARLAPLSPVDLHGYWRSGSLDLESSVNIAALANAYLTQRGTFSYVLLTLAGQQANSVITISRLAVRLGNNINAEDLRVILDTLSKPPFLALTPLPNGQYILRRTMPTMLEELADYAQTMQNRLQQAESEQ